MMVTTLIEQPIVSGKNGVDTAPPLPLRLGNDGPLWMGNKPARQSRPPSPPRGLRRATGCAHSSLTTKRGPILRPASSERCDDDRSYPACECPPLIGVPRPPSLRRWPALPVGVLLRAECAGGSCACGCGVKPSPSAARPQV